jgi:hypothetical protein
MIMPSDPSFYIIIISVVIIVSIFSRAIIRDRRESKDFMRFMELEGKEIIEKMRSESPDGKVAKLDIKDKLFDAYDKYNERNNA